MILDTLYEALYEEYQQERDGIHVSDLIYCPRKTCFQKIEPMPLTAVQLNFFTSGKAIHAALQSLIKKYPERFEIEKEVWYNNLVAHIDIYDNENMMPIEAKSARVAKMEKAKPHNIAQLEAYMAMTDSDKGLLLYQCLLHYEDKPFVEFVHIMTKSQRIFTLEKLKSDASALQEGIRQNNPSLVRHIAYDNNYNWLCRSCPYTKKCDKMRAAERGHLFQKIETNVLNPSK